MAQIKKIVKPGDLIRGAKVGVAGLDKDGNVIGVPGITVPAPAASDVGKALTAGSNGPVWSTIPGVTPLYYHPVAIYGTADGSYSGLSASLVILTNRAERFTTWTDLLTWVRNNNISYLSPASGSVYTGAARLIISWIDVKATSVSFRGHLVNQAAAYLSNYDVSDEDVNNGIEVYDFGVNRIL